MLRLLLTSLFMTMALGLSAQEYPWEFGLQIGTSTMGGDLIENDLIFLNQPSFAAGIHIRRRLGGTLALRAHLLYGGLQGDDNKSEDEFQRQRGYKSETSILEPGLVLEWEPLANKRFPLEGGFKKILSPYAYLGISMGFWQEVDVDFNGDTGPGIQADRQADKETSSLFFPGGLGLRYYVSPKTSLALDFGVRLSSTDYLDAVSQAGNPTQDDSYAFAGIVANFSLGQKDSDKDGIIDDEDLCPEVPGPIATGGCPDTDGDGIADANDVCPELAGVANLAGCPDADGDGVADGEDQCPNEAGTLALMGCPDADGDGIADGEDNCPTLAGTAALMGCPDSDGDGVADNEDECPDESGSIALKGCPDSDADGIADKDDECPTVAGVAARNGCPDPVAQFESLADRIERYRPLVEGLTYVSIDETTGTIQIQNLYFDTDRERLRNLGTKVLDDVATFLSRPGAEDFTLRFEGHADERYTEAYNQTLSEERAESALDYVNRKGVDADRLSMIGFGETRPLDGSLQENRVVVHVANEPPRPIED